MNFSPLTSEIIIEFLQKKLCQNGYLPLNLQEEIIIQGIIHQETYEKIANVLYISPGTTRNIASRLFRRLSILFSCKLTKINFLISIQKIFNDQTLDNSKLEINTYQESNSNFSKLLLIDDQLENLLLLKQILTQKNYIVRTVKSGRMALEFMDKIKPDLILLDIIMPELDGYAVCKALKQNPQHKEIPVIFLSAVNDLRDKVQGFNLGACDYITKPFEAVEILARISYQLELQSQRRELQAEIEAHQKTIESLTQSRSILANLLNHTSYGIAALSAIRNPESGEIIDFKFLLVNPVFTALFPHCSMPIENYSSCASFFREHALDWLNPLINVVTDAQSFAQISHVGNQTVEVRGIKLGDGVNLILNPLVHNSSLSSIDQALNRSINA